jgi:uncharacterized protein (TIGR02246 family)
MFERYTEKARRVVFFARFEASQYGSQYIETEHLLLGLTRENFPLMSDLIGYGISVDGIREEIEKHVQRGERFSTSVEVPLSAESKRVLNHAAEEADRLGHRHIGTEHMLLGLLREKKAHAAVILKQQGADIAEIRLKLAGSASPYRGPTKLAVGTYLDRTPSTPAGDAMVTLSSFLSGLKARTSPELADFFAQNGQFIDVCGKMWFGRAEIKTAFERLFAPYAKKNTTYHVERTVSERPEAVLASVLWENAVHTDQTSRSVLRMTILLVPEGEEWSIFLVQVVPVIP